MLVKVILYMLNKLRIEEGETSKLVLVEVHHEQLVGWGQVSAFTGKLPIKIWDIFAMTLEIWHIM